MVFFKFSLSTQHKLFLSLFVFFTGRNLSGDDVMTCAPTDSLQSSSTSGILLSEGQQLYVTVTCSNWLNFKSNFDVISSLKPSQPPSTQTAFVDVIANQYTYYKPRDSAQFGSSPLTFTYGGFGSSDVISQYQYRLLIDGSSTDWISVGQQVNAHYLFISVISQVMAC